MLAAGNLLAPFSSRLAGSQQSVAVTVLLCENRDKAASWRWHFRQIFFCSPESSLRFHLNPQKTASH